MKKFVFAAIALLLAASVTYPQQTGWSRTYGGYSSDFAYGLQQTQDNGYIMVGRTNSFGAGSFDLWLLRTDSVGDTSWTKTYGGESWDQGVRIEPTLDSGYVIVGQTGSFGVGHYNIWLLKIDGTGDTLWSKTYGEVGYEANGVFVTQTSDSGYVIIGDRKSWDLDSAYIWFIKTDANGDTIYTHSYGGNEYDDCISAQRVGEAGFIVLGDLWEEGNCLIRLYDDGTVYWIEPCNVWEPEYVQLAGLGFLVTGCDYKTGGEWPYLCLYETDFWGFGQFKEFYGGENWDEGVCIQPTNDGYSIVTGYRDYHGIKHSELWLLKVDPYWGDTIWTRTYGGDSIDVGTYAQQTNDSGFIVLGYTRSFGAGASDLWLLKTDANGDTIPPAVEEQVMDSPADWDVSSPVGARISLRYSDYPQGFHASVFDASGRRVDEVHATERSGTITWGDNASRGVYFMRAVSGNSAVSRKVVLVR